MLQDRLQLLRNGVTHHFLKNLVLGRLLGRLFPLPRHLHLLLLRTVTKGAILDLILEATPEVTLAGIMMSQLMATIRGHHITALRSPMSIQILAFRLSP